MDSSSGTEESSDEENIDSSGNCKPLLIDNTFKKSSQETKFKPMSLDFQTNESVHKKNE